MKRSQIFTISLLLLISTSFVASIHGRENSHGKSPVTSPAPAPSKSDCSTIIFNMADCLSFISDESKDLTPTKTCCDGMNSVLGYNPVCLCAALDVGRQMGIQMNNTRAVSLPSLCKSTVTPPDCGIPNAGPSPNASPVAPTPAPIPTPSSPTPPPAEAPGNSAAPPDTLAPGTGTSENSPSSGAGTLSVSVLFLVAMTLSYFA